MNKAVLISIKPKWCELIANLKKTLEIRTTKPSLKPPFKVYIYCTKEKVNGEILLTHDKKVEGRNRGFRNEGDIPLAGTVIGEFICDEIIPIRVFENGAIQDYWGHALTRSCVPYDDIASYIGNDKIGYGWHISDLIIYDSPKALIDFNKWGAKEMDDLDDELCSYCKDTERGTLATYGTPSGPVFCEGSFCDMAYETYIEENFMITRPPQSWHYCQALN